MKAPKGEKPEMVSRTEELIPVSDEFARSIAEIYSNDPQSSRMCGNGEARLIGGWRYDPRKSA
tara:strand:- start:17119 stop:17307 length:189 start_codon:yes stop_codon:yes gene_type:complete